MHRQALKARRYRQRQARHELAARIAMLRVLMHRLWMSHWKAGILAATRRYLDTMNILFPEELISMSSVEVIQDMDRIIINGFLRLPPVLPERIELDLVV